MVIVDSILTKRYGDNDDGSSNKVVFKMDMPEYTQHAACCMLWKKYIYIVGGELEGKWRPQAHRFNLNSFEFDRMPDLDLVIKMGSLTPLVSNDISGVFIAGLLEGSEESQSMIQFYYNSKEND